jgi:hypothetical protein
MKQGSKPKAIWRRAGSTMVPANEDAQRALAALAEGKDYLGEFKGARSLKQLKLYWSLMGLISENGIFPSREFASDATKIALGHVDTVIFPDTGEAVFIPKSIAFQSMPQHDFSVFFESALDIICARWLGGANKDDIRKEAYRRIDGPSALGERIDGL